MRGPKPPAPLGRVRPAGKFLYAGAEKFLIRGVTYGTFGGSSELPDPGVVAADLAAMASVGVNTVRVYTVPPRWLLDLAAERGLRVLVGIPWAQHITFLDAARDRRAIVQAIRSAVRASAGHVAVLGYVLGNEIPPGIVRWHGRERVERFLEQLYRAAKAEDPEALVTYANYPSTEYLELPFLDVVCFNVFLEERRQLASYLARLQTIAGDRPLIISELGLDSHRHGLEGQATSITAQVSAAFGGGCAGCCVFSWTDEWTRAGRPVDDWDFGVVDRAREPKPALEALRVAFAHDPCEWPSAWPKVSVVVCTYNGAGTIAGCVDAVLELDYPDYEVIIVDDGSTDDTALIAEAHGARVVRTPNHGLSVARNTGVAASGGEVVAFCDDDCRPDRDWLRYLVGTLMNSDHAGVGGPNIPPPAGVVADSVGHAPGGPTHVLASPTEAEHIPGCNMAFRRRMLDAVGGFDPRFRVAGDDVDLCWRIQAAGETLGFSPGAVVWHQARSSVRGYIRQQVGYGRAEALLERKWPERYSDSGHLDWNGTVHGGKARRSFGRRRWQVYYGRSGSALFQSVYSRRAGEDASFPLAPEWYLLVLALVLASAWDAVARPLLPRIPVIGVPVSLVLLLACVSVMSARAAIWAMSVVLPPSMARRRALGVRLLTFSLCLLQPLARLSGRTGEGLTPWRARGPYVLATPRPRVVEVWSERWLSAERWTCRMERGLVRGGAQVVRGGDWDTWDLQVRTGALAAARIRLAVEEHGEGRQMARFRIWPRWSSTGLLAEGILAGMAAVALARSEIWAAAVIALAVIWLAARIALQAAASTTAPVRAIATFAEGDAQP